MKQVFEIRIGSESLDLYPDTVINYRIKNNLNSPDAIDGFMTFDFDVPIGKASKKNTRLLNYPAEVNNYASPLNFIEAKIYFGRLIWKYVLIKKGKASPGNISISMKGDSRYIGSALKDKKLNELELGGVRFNATASLSDAPAADINSWDFTYARVNAPKFTTEESMYIADYLGIINYFEGGEVVTGKTAGGVTKFSPPVPFVYAFYIAKQIFEENGYLVELSLPTELLKLLVFNNCSLDGVPSHDHGTGLCNGYEITGAIDLKRHMPDVTVAEFLNSLKNAFNLGFFYSTQQKKVEIKLLKDLLTKPAVKDWTRKVAKFYTTWQDETDGFNFKGRVETSDSGVLDEDNDYTPFGNLEECNSIGQVPSTVELPDPEMPWIHEKDVILVRDADTWYQYQIRDPQNKIWVETNWYTITVFHLWATTKPTFADFPDPNDTDFPLSLTGELIYLYAILAIDTQKWYMNVPDLSFHKDWLPKTFNFLDLKIGNGKTEIDGNFGVIYNSIVAGALNPLTFIPSNSIELGSKNNKTGIIFGFSNNLSEPFDPFFSISSHYGPDAPPDFKLLWQDQVGLYNTFWRQWMPVINDPKYMERVTLLDAFDLLALDLSEKVIIDKTEWFIDEINGQFTLKSIPPANITYLKPNPGIAPDNLNTDIPQWICDELWHDGVNPTPGTKDEEYSFTLNMLSCCIGDLHFSIESGALAPGLTLNPDTGEIHGTPRNANTYPCRIKVTDDCGNTAYIDISHQITGTPCTTLNWTNGENKNNNIDDVINWLLTSSGCCTGLQTFSLFEGSFPPGISLLNNVISGSIGGSGGTYNYTLKLVDECGNISYYTQTWVVNPCTYLVWANNGVITNMVLNDPYNFILIANGCCGPFTWSYGSPTTIPGMSFNGSYFTGNPTVAGTYDIIVRVTDSCNNINDYGLMITVT